MSATFFNRRQTVAALGLALGGRVWAQAPSDKTVRLVLPHAVASGVDTITRSAQPALARALGQTVVVENQPGAGGVVGIQSLARSAPDGLTLSFVSNNVVIFPAVIKSLPFDLNTDVTPVAICGYTPIVLVANPKVGVHSARELIAYLKARNGEANYASSGTGTILHLASEMFLDEAGVNARHIPYKGVGPMLTDLIGGQVDFATAALPSVQAHLKSDALRAIGMCTAQRVVAAPEIPTFVEQGLPGYVVEAWFALLAPKGLNMADARRINTALVAAFGDPAAKDAMQKQGNVVHISSVEYAQKFFRDEMAKYAKLVKKAGIEPE